VLISAAFSPLLGLIVLCVVGGGYALAANAIARRFGPMNLLLFWTLAGLVLATVGTFRNLSIQRSAGVDPARVSTPGLYVLLGGGLLTILSLPTLKAWRHTSRTVPQSSVAQQFLSGVGWTATGLVLAVAVAFVLDLLNVPFIPLH
jgi:hypothetical protein